MRGIGYLHERLEDAALLAMPSMSFFGLPRGFALAIGAILLCWGALGLLCAGRKLKGIDRVNPAEGEVAER